MKIFKKIAAMLLVVIMAISVCGCHKKNEIAVTIGEYEYTSAYYMCALISAFSEAQDLAYNSATAQEQESGNIDYFSKKIGDKTFSKWTKDRAIEILKTVSYYKAESKKAGVTIDEGSKEASDYYASILWQNYQELYENNGVSEATFKKYFSEGAPSQMTDFALSQMIGLSTPNDYEELYFQYVYGKKGPKEISIDDVKKKLYDDYLIADIIEVSFSEETEDEKKVIKKQFEEYETKLKNGKMTFKEVYKDYNKITDDKNLPTSAAKDPFANVLTSETNENYDDIKKLKTDEVKLYEDKDTGALTLVVKKDIKSDEYYLDLLDNTIRHTLKDTEYYKTSDAAIAKLKADVNSFAIDQFEVDKIIVPQYQ